jgi:hypothetical protein
MITSPYLGSPPALSVLEIVLKIGVLNALSAPGVGAEVIRGCCVGPFHWAAAQRHKGLTNKD